MNKKRWIALLIAGVLLLFWLIAPTTRTDESTVEELLKSNKLTQTYINKNSTLEKIVILEIDGTIVSGTGESIFSGPTYNHSFFMAQLKEIQEDNTIKAILLEVNSPGGGVYESSEIARELKKIQQTSKIPLYVSMKNMAASGGYYVAASADKIFASEETMTGSIGVIMSGLNMTGLYEKMGLSQETIKSGPLKDMGSSTRQWNDEDREVFQSMIDSSYGRFVKIVSEGRGIPEDKVREIADGRIYDGEQAKQVDLVDEIGFPEDALRALRIDNNLKSASLVKYELPTNLFSDYFGSSWLGSSAQKLFGKKESDVALLVKTIEKFGTEETPKMMYLYGGE